MWKNLCKSFISNTKIKITQKRKVMITTLGHLFINEKVYSILVLSLAKDIVYI